jgi:FkbM family methyltransferase
MLATIHPGDCVWDVGANLGHYTALFGDRVGPDGLVLAFEPAPGPFAKLAALGLSNVVTLNAALGDRAGRLPLNVDDDPLGSTHSLVTGPSKGGTVDVRVVPGDAFVADEGLRAPNVVKVDVEGFEEEVINGMASELARPSCRALFCEVHFAILEARGERQAPSRIEQRLRSLGFATSWIDGSHLAAHKRPSPADAG